MSEFTNFVERFEKKVDNMNQKIDNARQEVLSLDPRVASVDGVYITNQSVRKQALSYIWAKYNMLPDNLTQSLGRLYDAVEEIYLPDKNDFPKRGLSPKSHSSITLTVRLRSNHIPYNWHFPDSSLLSTAGNYLP